jgi:hypothetical protein
VVEGEEVGEDLLGGERVGRDGSLARARANDRDSDSPLRSESE